MSRTKPQAPTTEETLSRAIGAVHNKFENALVAEWATRGDAAKIRNAMEPLRNRCQQCKKPVAGVGDICECKTKIAPERCFLNPRNALLDLLRQRCQSILVSVALAKFVEEITRIGVANGRDLDWVQGQIQDLRSSFSHVYRKWMVGVCSPSFNGAGQLPAWLKGDAVIVGTELYRSLSHDDSETELAVIENQIAQYFEEVERAALDLATIQVAQVVRPVPEQARHKRARQDIFAAMIAKIKRDSPGLSIEQICQLLDVKHCPLRESDKRAGYSNWHALWKHPQHRNRIKRFISAIEPAAAEKKI
jgi:hypothetical protein